MRQQFHETKAMKKLAQLDFLGDRHQWVRLVVLFVGGGLIYQLPYLRFAFYKPMLQTFAMTDADLGLLGGAYGITAGLAYFPGGWLADKFSCRNLIAFSLIATGLGGLYFATVPSFQMNLVLSVFWGAVTNLTYWASLIKAAGTVARGDNRGRVYGVLEGGRGLTATLAAFAAYALLTQLGGNRLGLQAAIVFYSLLTIAAGVLSYIFLSESAAIDGRRAK